MRGGFMVDVGDPAPDFALPADDGNTYSLKDFRGRKVVLYFYPKDNTPGCTREACDFRDNLPRVEGKGAVVLGVSKDSVKSHGNFRDKYDLTFPLLSDKDQVVHEAYGVLKNKSAYGRTFLGTERSTFIIDENGIVQKAYRKVRVKGHVDQILEDLA